jgi:hypothetical protein
MTYRYALPSARPAPPPVPLRPAPRLTDDTVRIA